MVRPLYPIKVLVPDKFFLLLKLNYEGPKVIGHHSRLVDGGDWIYAQSRAAGIVPRLPIRPIRAKLHSSDGKDAAN